VILHGRNQSLPFVKDVRGDYGGFITCDLGPLQIHFAGQRLDFASGVLIIEFLDEDVYCECSASFYTLTPGPWLATLVT
jgi:hypothetical protein